MDADESQVFFEGDDSDDELALIAQTRRWRAPILATVVALIVVLLFLLTSGSTEQSPADNLEALPGSSTTTTAPTTTTSPSTTVTSSTSTTVRWGATEAAVELLAVVRDGCERASLIDEDGMKPLDNWVESLFIDGEWMYYYLEEAVFLEAAVARNAQDQRLVDLLDSVAGNLEEVEATTDFVLHHTEPGRSNEWTYQVLLGERHCTAATATIATMVATSAATSTSTTWWRVTDPDNIDKEIRSLCLLASPVGPEKLKTIEESLESVVSSDWWTTHNRVSIRVDNEAYPARLAQDALFVNLLESVASDLDDLAAAVENAYRYNPDLDPDVWAYHAQLIERHCSSAAATVATIVATSN